MARRTPTSSKVDGIIFSNELLDAFPVHRFGWDAKNKTWFEWGVAVEGEKFVWAKIPSLQPFSNSAFSHWKPCCPTATPSKPRPPPKIGGAKPPAFWRVANCWPLTTALPPTKCFHPRAPAERLRAYFRHHATDDLLANPGEQDLTAHVNFSAIQTAGEAAGLKTEFFGSQAKFLVDILAQAQKNSSLGEWNTGHTRQFQTLTHPEHLGRAFRVLVQKR